MDTASAMLHVAEVPPIDDASSSGSITGAECLKKSLVAVLCSVYSFICICCNRHCFLVMNNSTFAEFMCINAFERKLRRIHQIIALSIGLMSAKYQLSHIQTVGPVRISVKIPRNLILIPKKILKSKV